MAQIFISYSRADDAFVERFLKRLQQAFPEVKLWHDTSPNGLIGGDNWWKTILNAIAKSDIFIYVLSNEAVISPYCQAEFTEARRLQKRIITIQARDRTEHTEELDDIQFINMTEGVDSADGLTRLTAAVNKQLQLARSMRPLWRPATPKPQKEQLSTRTADSESITTPVLTPPTSEMEAIKLAKQALWWQIAGTLVGIFGLILAVIAIIPRGETNMLTATPMLTLAPTTAVALVGVESPTLSVTVTPSITETPSQTPTELPIKLIVGTLDAQATLDQATANAEATLSARATVYAQMTQAVIDATATATLWTATPTPNMTASIEAYRTQQAQTVTRAWVDSWTHTPTPTPTFTATHTPTHTFTPTRTPTPTPNATQTLVAIAEAGITANADWTPVEDVKGGVPMVYVPAGCFTIGNENDGISDNSNGNELCLTPFWLDKTEVAQSQFRSNNGVKANANYFPGDNRPVERITWFEANAYCEARGGRLPTEAEWEFSARGPDGLVYSWGNDFVADNVVYGENSGSQTAEVGSKPSGASWVGALDLSGNVWEWTSSLYKPYPYRATDGREDLTATGSRVVRGGSWFNDNTGNFRAANRINNGSGNNDIGFRCVRSS